MTAPTPADVELINLIDQAWRNAPCPKCGRVKACRCLLGDEELRKYRARAVLDALAVAGRLLPPDADTRTEWATRLAAIDGYDEELSHSFEGAGSTEEERARRRAEVWVRRFGAEHVDVMRRTIWTGPWVPVPTTKES